MSKVSEKKADAQRLLQKQDKQARMAKADGKAKTKFGERMKKQGSQLNEQRQTMQQQTQAEGQNHRGESAKNARLARGGIMRHSRLLKQAKSFGQTLNRAQTETKEGQQTRTETRAEKMEEAREAEGERLIEFDEREQRAQDLQQDDAKAEARGKGVPNAAIDSDGGKGGHNDGSGSSGHKAEAVGAAEGTKAGKAPQQISEEILKALANEIFVGVNAEGFAEFHIELKDGVLDGGALKVTADGDGGVKLHFQRLDKMSRNLVKASETELTKRLATKGVRLTGLVVD